MRQKVLEWQQDTFLGKAIDASVASQFCQDWRRRKRNLFYVLLVFSKNSNQTTHTFPHQNVEPQGVRGEYIRRAKPLLRTLGCSRNCKHAQLAPFKVGRMPSTLRVYAAFWEMSQSPISRDTVLKSFQKGLYSSQSGPPPSPLPHTHKVLLSPKKKARNHKLGGCCLAKN